MCVCVCVCVCACVCERENERKSVCVCACVCVYVLGNEVLRVIILLLGESESSFLCGLFDLVLLQRRSDVFGAD